MSEKYIWETEEGVFLRVLVRPKSRERALISAIDETYIVLNLKSPAREGRANTEMLKRLSKILKTSTGNLSLIAGHKSKQKIIQIKGMNRKAIIVCIGISYIHK